MVEDGDLNLKHDSVKGYKPWTSGIDTKGKMAKSYGTKKNQRKSLDKRR